jgi:hypothetical protein
VWLSIAFRQDPEKNILTGKIRERFNSSIYISSRKTISGKSFSENDSFSVDS